MIADTEPLHQTAFRRLLTELEMSPALADDWAAWVKAWQTLDAGPLARLRETAARGLPAALTLCGERAWVRFEAAPGGLLRRARALFRSPGPLALMETL